MEEFNNLLKKALLKDYVPKKDVQQNEFLKKYPEFDGRGIKIAIIDSVVDLSLSGMQKTSTGLPKIIDCFDFTDNGNVDTSVIRKSGDDNTLTLLSGREISIPPNWKNPLNEWHLGKKFLQEIFPSLLEKMEEKEKLNENDIQEFPRFVDKIVAEKLSDNYNFDFIVWNDGKKWQACLIPSFLKHVENAKVLTNFHDEHQFCYLLDDISCGIRIEEGGNFLKLLICCHDHGTLVAQVVAAHFPNEPEKDGLAPGAQIISINFMGENVNVSTIKKANPKRA
uniref:Peptidase S8/S53 domain-containing protein n=1 Tax=Panagrolaimus superbus TaxID=310955 RepID=A0A914Z0W0_9BILA